jgi:hypothetical protein
MGSRWCVKTAIACALFHSACSRSPRAPQPEALSLPQPQSVTAAPLAPSSSPSGAAPPPVGPLCGDPGSILLFVSPARPLRGEPVRLIAVSDRAVDAQLAIDAPTRASAPRTATQTPTATATPTATQTPTTDRNGGPPYHWLLPLDPTTTGTYKATLTRSDACGGGLLAKKDIAVTNWRPPSSLPAPGELWPTRAAWSPSLETLYSAWIEHLFDAPLDAQPSWNALHEVLRDRSRNFLFNHLGAAEDEQGIVIRPDCADLPYFLRAYFSLKLGLPFGWSRCSRGEGGTAPTCSDFATNVDPFPPIDGKAQTVPQWANPDPDRDPKPTITKRFGEFLRTTLADAAQSGAGRTPANDETGDYYPVSLSVDTLRPGTIFADPYGHVLVVAKRISQTPAMGGILLAVDGQPDGTVARKRFWRGNFLFAIDPALGSAGFKRFRPIVRGKGGTLRHLGNSELPDYSVEQYDGGVDGFYDRVEDVLSPALLDPMQALLETIQALEEQVKTRAASVDNGRKFLSSGKPAAEMPDGAKIFETTGEWEDFSTPSRDLRLLIAIDVARGAPARVLRRPERYAMPASKPVDQVRRELEERLGRELRDRKFKYTRSDGSDWQLSLEDVVDREVALEMAYDPNDCVEERWGAPLNSGEASTCNAHAPAPQIAKMQGYRAWFHERRRPPR